MAMEAFEFAGSGPGEVVDLSGGVSAGVGAGSFTPPLPAALADVTGDAIRGSDIIVLRYLSSENVRSVLPNVAANTMTVQNPWTSRSSGAATSMGSPTARAFRSFRRCPTGLSSLSAAAV